MSLDRYRTAIVTGGNNWLATGVNPGPLTNTVFSSAPGFVNAATNNFRHRTRPRAFGRRTASDYFRE